MKICNSAKGDTCFKQLCKK